MSSRDRGASAADEPPSNGAARTGAAPWPTRLQTERAAIETSGLSKRYGAWKGRAVLALDGVDLTVPEGSTYLLVGPNGAGKTTALSALLDLVRPTDGSVRVLERDPHTDGAAVRAQIGFVPERADFGYGWMRVDRLLHHHARYRPRWDHDYARELSESLEVETKRKFGKLSKGQARRVELVMALAAQPRLLLLDEPTDGLDPLMRERVLGLLATHRRRFPTTVLISTHLIHEADRLADHVAVLDRGRVMLQCERDELTRMVRRYHLETDVPRTQLINAAVVARSQDTEGPNWFAWGDEERIGAMFEDAGIRVRRVSRPTLEQALVAFLSRGSARHRDAEEAA